MYSDLIVDALYKMQLEESMPKNAVSMVAVSNKSRADYMAVGNYLKENQNDSHEACVTVLETKYQEELNWCPTPRILLYHKTGSNESSLGFM